MSLILRCKTALKWKVAKNTSLYLVSEVSFEPLKIPSYNIHTCLPRNISKTKTQNLINQWLINGYYLSVGSCFKAYLGSNDNHKVKPLDCYAMRLGGLWSVTTCKNVLLPSNSNLELWQKSVSFWLPLLFHSMVRRKSFVFFLIFLLS